MGALLAIEGLHVRFGGLRAVDGFSMAVTPGTIHALIGPNGAGKSTVLNAISRFNRPAEGDIRFAGNTLLRLPPHRLAAILKVFPSGFRSPGRSYSTSTASPACSLSLEKSCSAQSPASSAPLCSSHPPR